MSQTNFYGLTPAETLKNLESDTKTGLKQADIAARQEKYGLNELAKEEKESIWVKILEQFKDTLVQILLGSAVISFVISQFEEQEEHGVPAWVEPAVIFTILILNGFVAIYQDLDAEKALDALMDLQCPNALVMRDSEWKEISSKELVPGDIIQVSQGDKVPADLRVLELKTITLKLDQSTLTGETNPVNKFTDVVNKKDGVGILDKINIMFSSTLVVNGSAIGVVVTTGMNTEIGIIQSQVMEAAQEKKEEDSPLKQKLDEFGDMLAKVITLICILCWAMNIPNFGDKAFGHWSLGAMYYFKVAVALAVAAIPEGLPAVITTCLALGTRRMAKQKAIIRKLQSVETLGCTTIICSDKTGTLTTNEMCVEHFFITNSENPGELKHFDVQGTSYQPEGEIKGLAEYMGSGAPENISKFLTCMSLCNESKLMWEKGKVTRTGLPTEAALKVLAEKVGLVDPAFKNKKQPRQQNVEQYNKELLKSYEKLATLEFSRDRKSMSVLARNNSTKSENLFIKGAPDYLLKKSNRVLTKSGQIVKLSDNDKINYEKSILELAKKGLRTLAICFKADVGKLQGYNGSKHPAHKDLENMDKYAELESDPILIGVVALRDPPRPEVKHSINKCKDAGISVIMITGDIKETAESIAKEISIINEGEEKTRSFTGHEFEAMKKEVQLENLQKVIDRPSGMVFSRTDPKHKRQLVSLLGSKKQIVAMTGDGVNDAPALKQAQIGVAMGITGTEVAKEASDMVLSDDNFSTIVAAVEEGRAIYANMKAFIRYMISSNIGEVVSIFLSSMIGIPDGFNSVQLLWVNLVTDGLPATALSFNPPDPDVMKKPPRKQDEQLISGFVFFRYLIIGLYVGFATVFVFVYYYTAYTWAGDGHPLVKFSQLRNWTDCSAWENFKVPNFGKYDMFDTQPCKYFTYGKQKASTLSLTVLVMIEMLNAINALSDESSLLTVGIFANPSLIIAIFGSVFLHCVICYVPFFERIFNTVPLTLNDWILVLIAAGPVIFIDELLKIVARARTQAALKARREKLE